MVSNYLLGRQRVELECLVKLGVEPEHIEERMAMNARLLGMELADYKTAVASTRKTKNGGNKRAASSEDQVNAAGKHEVTLGFLNELMVSGKTSLAGLRKALQEMPEGFIYTVCKPDSQGLCRYEHGTQVGDKPMVRTRRNPATVHPLNVRIPDPTPPKKAKRSKGQDEVLPADNPSDNPPTE